jgi:hypothetical protein
MKIGALVLCGIVATFAVPALAHHSFSMFDREKYASVTGTVSEYEWTNPHVWIHVKAPDAQGKMVEWGFEMQSIAQDTRAGWRADTVKTGDKITIEYHPLKDGSRGGQLTSAVLANGTRLGPPPPDGFLSVKPGDGGI